MGSPGRTRYARTDATTEYPFWPNQHWIVYNPLTSRFFVTDPSSNKIIVLDGASETAIGTISVPGAYGLDEAPDHRTLYVGTLIGDVYVVDPVTMAVRQRYTASQIGPDGFPVTVPLVLADGRLAILGGMAGIIGVDGVGGFAIWNPTDNSFILYGRTNTVLGIPLPCGPIFGFSLSVDRRRVITDAGNAMCEIDEATGGVIDASVPSIGVFALTPDGKYIIVPTGTSLATAELYDANTLRDLRTLNFNVQLYTQPTFAMSADSRTLFLVTDSVIYGYDLATSQPTGWAPNIYLPPITGGLAGVPTDSPYLLAQDGTGLFAGPIEEGVGFIDLSTLHDLPVGTLFTNAYLTPGAGAVSGGTQIQESSMTAPVQGAVYFGANKSPQVSNSGYLTFAASPPGTPGPVTIYNFSSDGGEQVVPDGFSYGPTILQVTPNMSPADGGGTGYIYGYGLGPNNSNSIPSDLHVTVAGTSAQITGFRANGYGVSSPPYPMQSAAYTIPPGVVGPADVTVTDSYGSTTARGAFTYLAASQQFPLPGASLAEGVYDPVRDLYYFTDVDKIQVFSRTQGKWLSPISVTPPQGKTERLWGISISPDSSKLVVSDVSAGVIYSLSPASTSSVKTWPVPQINFTRTPSGLAVNDKGDVYYAVISAGASGGDQFFRTNILHGGTFDYQLNGPGLPRSDMYLRTAVSPDNTHAYLNELGNIFVVDAADKLTLASVEPNCCYGDYELTVSNDGQRVTASSYFYDPQLNGESYYSFNDREVLNLFELYGAKFNLNGGLLFQPTTLGIDVLDGHLGNLLTRVALPVPLASSSFDALVADGKDQVLVGITGQGDGIVVVDLTQISAPPPLPYNVQSPDDSSFSALRRALPASQLQIQKNVSIPAGVTSQRPHFIRHAITTLPASKP